MTQRTRAWLLCGLGIPLAVALDRLAAGRPEAVELHYTQGLYLPLAQGLGAVTDVVPFSIGEAFIAGAVLWMLTATALGIRAVTSGERALGVQLGRWGARILGGAGVLLALFMMLWGVNLHRVPLAEQLGLEPRPATPEEVLGLAGDLAVEAAAVCPWVPRDLMLQAYLPGGLASTAAVAQAGYDALSPKMPQVAGRYGTPKALVASGVSAYLGIAGFFFPYTGEAQINDRIPPVTLPFTICHEMAHQRGYVREDEANFVGILACEAHPEIAFRYAATFSSLLYVLQAVRQAAPEAYGPLVEGLPPEMVADLDALRAYRDRYDTRISDSFARVHDASLKAQGQGEGVQTYGKVVDLLIARWRLKHSTGPEMPE